MILYKQNNYRGIFNLAINQVTNMPEDERSVSKSPIALNYCINGHINYQAYQATLDVFSVCMSAFKVLSQLHLIIALMATLTIKLIKQL